MFDLLYHLLDAYTWYSLFVCTMIDHYFPWLLMIVGIRYPLEIKYHKLSKISSTSYNKIYKLGKLCYVTAQENNEEAVAIQYLHTNKQEHMFKQTTHSMNVIGSMQSNKTTESIIHKRYDEHKPRVSTAFSTYQYSSGDVTDQIHKLCMEVIDDPRNDLSELAKGFSHVIMLSWYLVCWMYISKVLCLLSVAGVLAAHYGPNKMFLVAFLNSTNIQRFSVAHPSLVPAVCKQLSSFMTQLQDALTKPSTTEQTQEQEAQANLEQLLANSGAPVAASC